MEFLRDAIVKALREAFGVVEILFFLGFAMLFIGLAGFDSRIALAVCGSFLLAVSVKAGSNR